MSKSTHLTFEDRLQIEEGIRQGLKGKKISALINRSASVANKEIKRNGGRENYNAIAAQERAEIILMQRKEEYIAPSLKNDLKNLPERVDNLEEQIKILTETLIGFMESNND